MSKMDEDMKSCGVATEETHKTKIHSRCTAKKQRKINDLDRVEESKIFPEVYRLNKWMTQDNLRIYVRIHFWEGYTSHFTYLTQICTGKNLNRSQEQSNVHLVSMHEKMERELEMMWLTMEWEYWIPNSSNNFFFPIHWVPIFSTEGLPDFLLIGSDYTCAVSFMASTIFWNINCCRKNLASIYKYK